MKILVVSDTHGNTGALLNVVAEVSPNLILHLGDFERDCGEVRKTYPELQLRAVRGNCDVRSMEPDTDEFVVENLRIFMTHGHCYGVKTSLDALLNAGLLRQAHVVLFGHTHKAVAGTFEGMLVLNPGSLGSGTKTYAILTVEHGVLSHDIHNLE